MLHEAGEETRHSRLFSRVIESIGPTAKLPVVADPRYAAIERLVTGLAFAIGLQFPSAFNAMVLAGEEIPDLFQKRVADHPDTDPFIRDASRYHRQEEARHLSFARMMVGELGSGHGGADSDWSSGSCPAWSTGCSTSSCTRACTPAGLPGIRTWLAVRSSPRRAALRHEATRPVLNALVDGGALRPGRIPTQWRRLCGVDRFGTPRPAPTSGKV